MSDESLRTNQEEETFYTQLVPVSLLIVLLAGIGVYGLLLLMEGSDIHWVGAGIVGVALVVGSIIWARRLVAAYPVYVNSRGVRVYGLRGGPLTDAHWLEWSAITRVSRFYVPFNPCLVLWTRTSKHRYWIPLKLVHATRFRELLSEYAGRAHPLTRALYE